MAGTAEMTARNPALAAQADILAHPASTGRRMADALRVLAIDAVEAARSGHPGMPMGMADAATVLWTRFLKFDAADPVWPDRDRFVLSAGHGSILLYALLHLTGHAGMGAEELRRYRQLHSPAAGYPEYGAHPAIEATTGPLGQGIPTAVGMALAERMLAARFGRSLVDHRTWVIASDGDLMEGISHEAIGLAGHLRLEKLTVLYDDNAVSIDGATALACSDDQLRRFAAHGWAVKRVEGHDAAQLTAAVSFAVRSKKPTLIACRTIIGLGAPTKAGTAAAHGAPLGQREAQAAKHSLGWKDPPFTVPDGVAERWRAAGSRGAAARRAWLKRLARHPLRTEFERVVAGRLPETWHEALAALKSEIAEQRPKRATRQSSEKTLEALVPAIPELVGGSADLTGSNLTFVKGMGTVIPGGYPGRYIHFGVREHAMAAAANGMALHGGFIPYDATFLVFADYMRPALRLGAIMGQRVIHVLTHDLSASARMGRPTSPSSTSRASAPCRDCMCSARRMRWRPPNAGNSRSAAPKGPSVLVLTRSTGAGAAAPTTAENRCARGGYVLAEAGGAAPAGHAGSPRAPKCLIAMAAGARPWPDEGIPRRGRSWLPCWELLSGSGRGVPRPRCSAGCSRIAVRGRGAASAGSAGSARTARSSE